MIFFAIAGAGATAVGGYVAYDRYQENQKTEIAKLAEPELKKPKTVEEGASKAAPLEKAPEETAAKTVEETPAAPLTPTFDIVRVEKDGSMLVAGQAEPTSEVTLMNGEQPIGTTTVDDTGAFVVLPDTPLKGADNQISIRSKLSDGTTVTSEQQVAVAIPEQGDVLVALVEPGKPVEILQKPKPKAEPEPVVVANTPDPEPTPEVVDAAPAKEVVAAAPEIIDVPKPVSKPVADAVSVLEEAKPVVKETVVAKVEEVVESVTTEEIKPELTPEVVQEPLKEARKESKKRVARLLLEQQEEVAPVVEEVVVEAPQPEAVQPEALKAPEASSPETPTVAAPAAEPVVEEPPVERVATIIEEKKPEPAKVAEPLKTITIEAVEVENDTLFVAGKAAPDETVRVYVDDELIGDIKTGEGGQWLLEGTKPLGPGKYDIRVDLLKQGSGDVLARAAVPFAVEDLTPAELADAKVGNVIIRKNDNLWTIAQRLYGDGRRYTSIYQQNKGQIKNPRLIFPGQIFKVPGEGQVPGAANTVDQVVVVAPSAKPETQ
ncbi:MAG: LysM peptidoglycan-binding domain-containing protein [Hyphomicrobiales bacterium]